MDWLQEFEHDPRLREAARAIASGTHVDWDALESSAGNDSLKILVRRLRAIAQIARAHASLQTQTPSADEGTPSNLTDVTTVAVPEHAGLGAERPLPKWGPLVLHERIGEGSFGEVFRAWDPRLDREVALKLLRHGRHAHGDDLGTAVIAEGRALARVRHPNVVTVYGADRVDGRVGVWMEYVHGRTLEELLRERGPLSVHEAVGAGLDVCRAIAAVHRAGLLHRDVKAQNVMREEGGRCVLTDFGTVAIGMPDGDEGTVIAGTPLYLAPEVIDGAAPTPLSDVYAVGVLLFHLVTGSFPVAARSFREVREAHRSGRRTLLRTLRPDLPYRFVDIVEQATSADPARRPASAAALERSLVEALVEREPPRDDAGRSEPSSDPARTAAFPARRRRRRIAEVAAIAAAITVAGGVAYLTDLGGVRSVLSKAPPGDSGTVGRLIARTDAGEIRMRRVALPGWVTIGRPEPGGRYLPYVTEQGNVAIFETATSISRELVKRSESDEWPYGSVPSHDGRRIAYAWYALDGTFELRTVTVDDGWIELVAGFPDAADLTPVEWTSDDRAVLVKMRDKSSKNHLVLADTASRKVRTLVTLDAAPTSASLSPDERLLVLDRWADPSRTQRDVVLRDLPSGEELPLAASDRFDVYPQWNESGDAVFFISDRTGTPSAWLQRVVNGQPDGPPQLAAQHLGPANSLGLTRTGAFYYLLHAAMMDVYTAALEDPASARAVEAPMAGQNEVPTWSPDGAKLAWIWESGFMRASLYSRTVVVRDVETGETRSLKPRLGFFTSLRWSPDGSRFLVVGYDERGTHGIFSIDAASGAAAAVVLDPHGDETGTSCPQWQPDGRGIFFVRKGAVRTLDLPTGREGVVFALKDESMQGLDGATVGACVQVSPDGGALAFSGRLAGGDKPHIVKIRPVDGPSREVLRGEPGERLLFQGWLPDGSGLLVVRLRQGEPRGELLRVSLLGGAPEPTGLSLEGLRNVTLNPRNSVLAFTAGVDRWEPWVLENFLR